MIGKALARLGLAAAASALVLLAAEGTLSLFFGRSLRPRDPFRDLAARMHGAVEQALGPASDDREQFRVHPDPRVGFVLRGGAGYRILESTYSADAFGVRGRPGPAPPEGALRIAVLGDSVAFGAGVDDDQTLAAQLERILCDACAGEGASFACYTIAVTGWNHRNAVNFLLDHFEHYRPDVVVYMPIDNDLTDTYGVFEDGNRRVMADLMAEQPLLAVNDEPRYLFQFALAQKVRSGELADPAGWDEIGPNATAADLTRESRRRYEDNARSIERLDRALAALGSRLALLHYYEQAPTGGYTWLLRDRLRERGLRVKEIPGLTTLDGAVTQGSDAHPNASCLRAFAIWTAEWLRDEGLVECSAPLPEVPARIAALRAAPRDDDDIRRRASNLRETLRSSTQAVLDLRRGRGIEQVFGGLNMDGTVGPRFLCMLRAPSARLRIEAEALSPPPACGTVEVEVQVDGRAVGSFAVETSTPRRSFEFEIPGEAAPDRIVEVGLVPSDWTSRPIGPRLGIASFRLHRIEAAEE